MIREVDTDLIRRNLKEMCFTAAHTLSPDVLCALGAAAEEETDPLGRQVLGTLMENLEIAKEETIPICQDTGMAVVFLEIGQDVHLTGKDLTQSVNEGVAEGYTEGYLRKSVVGDPLIRKNTGNNAPAVLHTSIVPGDKVKITLAPKGFGSENKSRLFMLTPADGVQGVKDAVMETVRAAGPNACPPFSIGVGVGGTFEYCALMAKKALIRPAGSRSPLPHIAELERELLEEINATGIGPAGLGGKCTALSVAVETYPTHIAGLPVAVNICCHVNRHCAREI